MKSLFCRCAANVHFEFFFFCFAFSSFFSFFCIISFSIRFSIFALFRQTTNRQVVFVSFKMNFLRWKCVCVHVNRYDGCDAAVAVRFFFACLFASLWIYEEVACATPLSLGTRKRAGASFYYSICGVDHLTNWTYGGFLTWKPSEYEIINLVDYAGPWGSVMDGRVNVARDESLRVDFIVELSVEIFAKPQISPLRWWNWWKRCASVHPLLLSRLKILQRNGVFCDTMQKTCQT